MTTSEMTTSETIKTSEKKYQTSGCARGPKNCETNRPSAQAPDPKSSKPHELKRAKNCATLLRYTDEMRETSKASKASKTKHKASGCACDPTSCEPQESRTQETKRPRVGPRTQVPLAGRVPVLSSRNRASPTSVLADEKVMPEKEPILALAEEKEIIGLMSSPAEEEPYITSTKNPFAALGELTDAEAATEATGSLDKMSEWPEGGIASAGNIVDKMSGCVRARLKWCPRS